MTSTSLPGLRAQFPGARGYLDTATYGLPSASTLAGVAGHLAAWRDGTGSLSTFHSPVERSRSLFAQLLGVPVEWVAIGSQVSVTVGGIAASLPVGARIVLPDNDFTSLLWPFLARPDLRCELVPLRELPDAVSRGCDWVAASTVQSADGALADLAGLRAAADDVGARVLLDATQSAGWLPLDGTQFDVVVASAYKWLMSPRGTTLAAIAPDALAALAPVSAGWYAGEDVMTSFFGAPARLAHDARRLDVSPAWPCWAGTQPALELLLEVGVEQVHRHDVGLANRLRDRLGLPPSNSAVVSLHADVERLRAAGLRCAGRDGRARLGFHLYNDEDDVEIAARALTA